MKPELVIELKVKFIESLTNTAYGNLSVAASNTGVSRKTIWLWRKEDANFDFKIQSAIKTGKYDLADLAESALVKKLEEGNITAIIFALKCLRRESYSEKQVEEVQNKRLDYVNNPDALMTTLLSYEVVRANMIESKQFPQKK